MPVDDHQQQTRRTIRLASALLPIADCRHSKAVFCGELMLCQPCSMTNCTDIYTRDFDMMHTAASTVAVCVFNCTLQTCLDAVKCVAHQPSPINLFTLISYTPLLI